MGATREGNSAGANTRLRKLGHARGEEQEGEGGGGNAEAGDNRRLAQTSVRAIPLPIFATEQAYLRISGVHGTSTARFIRTRARARKEIYRRCVDFVLHASREKLSRNELDKTARRTIRDGENYIRGIVLSLVYTPLPYFRAERNTI